MKKYIKISAYNRFDHKTLVETFINLNYVVSLTIFTDSKETWYMLYLTDGSYRVSKESYDKLVHILYGEPYEVQNTRVH